MENRCLCSEVPFVDSRSFLVMEHAPTKEEKCKPGQISTSTTSSGKAEAEGNDCAQEKNSRWRASTEGGLRMCSAARSGE
uniref:Uncharacterized protein n=1 Tax=Arundo donax TaxID=35708 RepID=A0A0A9GC42_ARUDO